MHGMNMIKPVILILIISISGFYGCRKGRDGSVIHMKELIKQYNNLLSEAYITMDLTELNKILTENHAVRLETRLTNVRKSQRRMESELKKIEFKDIVFPDDKSVIVSTKEVWDIRHIDLKTKKMIKEHKGYVYDLRYELAKKGDTWLIDNVVVIDEREPLL